MEASEIAPVSRDQRRSVSRLSADRDRSARAGAATGRAGELGDWTHLSRALNKLQLVAGPLQAAASTMCAAALAGGKCPINARVSDFRAHSTLCNAPMKAHAAHRAPARRSAPGRPPEPASPTCRERVGHPAAAQTRALAALAVGARPPRWYLAKTQRARPGTAWGTLGRARSGRTLLTTSEGAVFCWGLSRARAGEAQSRQ